MKEREFDTRETTRDERKRRVIKDGALSFAQKLIKTYKLLERLSLSDSDRQHLFQIHLARYCLLKENYKTSSFLRKPGTEAMGKWPILGKIVSYLRRDCEMRDSTAEELMDEAAIQAEVINEVAKGNPEEALSLWSPTTIQRAANLISASFFQNKYQNQNDRYTEVDATVNTVKLWKN